LASAVIHSKHAIRFVVGWPSRAIVKIIFVVTARAVHAGRARREIYIVYIVAFFDINILNVHI